QREGVTEEIMIGFYSHGGGTSGEFAIRWIELGGYSTPRLEVFSDAWEALSHFRDLLDALACLPQRADPQTVIEVLRQLGLTDLTQRVDPNGPRETPDVVREAAPQLLRTLRDARAYLAPLAPHSLIERVDCAIAKAEGKRV